MTTGEGGIITTDNEEIAEFAKIVGDQIDKPKQVDQEIELLVDM